MNIIRISTINLLPPARKYRGYGGREEVCEAEFHREQPGYQPLTPAFYLTSVNMLFVPEDPAKAMP